MNPYRTFSDVLFTCVDGPSAEIVKHFLVRFNAPDKWSKLGADGKPINQYFAKEIPDISLPYINIPDRDTRRPKRIIFWEPRILPGTTVLVGQAHDGLSHSIFRLSEDSPYSWVNVRIYNDSHYDGCFFSYYANCRTTLRRLTACKDEDGWEFAQEGPIQSFENLAYYSRRQIKDRLNKEIIKEYMEKLGYLIAEDGFWETTKPASLLWQERPATATS